MLLKGWDEDGNSATVKIIRSFRRGPDYIVLNTYYKDGEIQMYWISTNSGVYIIHSKELADALEIFGDHKKELLRK